MANIAPSMTYFRKDELLVLADLDLEVRMRLEQCIFTFCVQVTTTTTLWSGGSGQQWRGSTTSRDCGCCRQETVFLFKQSIPGSSCGISHIFSSSTVCDWDFQYSVRGLCFSARQQRTPSLLCGKVGEGHFTAQVRFRSGVGSPRREFCLTRSTTVIAWDL